MAMEDYITRMMIESIELGDRIEKMATFVRGPSYRKLSSDEQDLLLAQAGAMTAYNLILSQRIARADGRSL